MSRLKGKVAVVTGASKGIGAAIAEELASEGASVVVNYAKGASEASALADKINSSGGNARAVQADVSHPAEGKKLIEAAVREFGKVDILVNNAGVYEFVPLPGIREESFDRMFNVNVRGPLFTIQAAADAFGPEGGSIVNISSIAAQAAGPATSVYSATKAALDALTRTLAAELGPRKIRVNSVLPGPVETEGTRAFAEFTAFTAQVVPQTPLGRVGQPHDIASAVSFLASDEAGWITGQVIPVAGGFRG